MNGWMSVPGEFSFPVPTAPLAIGLIGIDGCEPCKIVSEQASAFVGRYPVCELSLFKVIREQWKSKIVVAYGRPVRFFPTLICFVDGLEIARLQGARIDIRPTDFRDIERRFGQTRALDRDAPGEADIPVATGTTATSSTSFAISGIAGLHSRHE